jgi:hypothetical protein
MTSIHAGALCGDVTGDGATGAAGDAGAVAGGGGVPKTASFAVASVTNRWLTGATLAQQEKAKAENALFDHLDALGRSHTSGGTVAPPASGNMWFSFPSLAQKLKEQAQSIPSRPLPTVIELIEKKADCTAPQLAEIIARGEKEYLERYPGDVEETIAMDFWEFLYKGSLVKHRIQDFCGRDKSSFSGVPVGIIRKGDPPPPFAPPHPFILPSSH